MRALASLFLTVFCVSGFRVFASDVPPNHLFEKTIVREARADGVPGLAYAIKDNGDWVIGTLGVRAIKGQDKVTKDTVFPLASVSKTFAGTLAALLATEGRLALDQSVTDDWPTFRLADNGVAPRITVAHLLSHTGGVVPNAYDNLLEAGKSIPQIIPNFKKVKTLCKPGSCYGYQNVMFSLSEPFLAEAGGEAYPILVADRLFAPLGMADSGVGFDFYQAATDKAAPHVRSRKRWYQRRHKPNYYRATPAAGVNASISDMVLWVDAIMGKRQDVIPVETIALATSPRINSTRERWRRHWRDHVDATWYGLGWRIFRFDGQNLVLHGGGVTGFRTLISFLPGSDKALILLLNGESRLHDKLATAFWARALPKKTASLSGGK